MDPNAGKDICLSGEWIGEQKWNYVSNLKDMSAHMSTDSSVPVLKSWRD